MLRTEDSFGSVQTQMCVSQEGPFPRGSEQGWQGCVGFISSPLGSAPGHDSAHHWDPESTCCSEA